MSASTEQRSHADRPERTRTVCCVCRGVIHDGPPGLVSHGVHPGDCSRYVRYAPEGERLLVDALRASMPILQSGGRYAHLVRPGQSILVDGVPALAAKLDLVVDDARRLLHVLDRGSEVEPTVLAVAVGLLRRSTAAAQSR